MDFDPQDCTQAPAARTVGRTVTDDPAADCVMVLNRDGVVVGVNRPGLQLMGADEAALRGRPWVEALPAEAAGGAGGAGRGSGGQARAFFRKRRTGRNLAGTA